MCLENWPKVNESPQPNQCENIQKRSCEASGGGGGGAVEDCWNDLFPIDGGENDITATCHLSDLEYPKEEGVDSFKMAGSDGIQQNSAS